MTSLFVSIDCPIQLERVYRAEKSEVEFKQGLSNLGYVSGSPGWNAILNPLTPMDKAFQIYALNLVLETNFHPEPTVRIQEDNIKLWEARDKCWKMAADWIAANTDILNNKTKEQQREINKLLPEALRIQASHELPPGPWEHFPRDATSQKKASVLHALTDKLQHLGLNLKINKMAQSLGESLNSNANMEYYKDYGTLVSLCNKTTKIVSQPELF